jgi:hypothetical protein
LVSLLISGTSSAIYIGRVIDAGGYLWAYLALRAVEVSTAQHQVLGQVVPVQVGKVWRGAVERQMIAAQRGISGR